MPLSRADIPNIRKLSDGLLRLLEDLPRALRALEEAKSKGQFDPQALSSRGFVVGTPRDALESVRCKLLKVLAPSKDEGSPRYAGGDSDITDSDLDLKQKVTLKALFWLCSDTKKWHDASDSRREETILQLLEWRRTLDPMSSIQDASISAPPSSESVNAGEQTRPMSTTQAVDDRQHADEFQKMLAAWRLLRMASRTSIHTLARYEPADDQTHQARGILHALQAHGIPTARFVASQCGSSESKAVLWWVKAQLADGFVLDNESASRFDDISLIVDNALLQVEASPASERRFMELAIDEARKSVAEDRRPHPKVGAVVIKDGKVIATAHRGEMAPGDHAEYTVLEKKLKDELLAGATVYATLEPCTRRGANRTPCAQRLVDRRVKRVVIGMLDPNPTICGKGQRLLQSRGIEVEHFSHDLVMQLEELNREFTKAQEAGSPPGMSTGSARNPLHEIIDLLIVYNRAFVQVHHAGTDEARRAALDEWRRCHPAVWGSSSSRNDTIRTLADPAKAWLTRTNSRYVELQDFNLVEECVHALSSFAISTSPMSMPEVYSKTYCTEQELWQRWNQQGEQVVELGNLIARLKELAARAGEAWTPATPLARGATSDANRTSDQRTPPQDPMMPSGQPPA